MAATAELAGPLVGKLRGCRLLSCGLYEFGAMATASGDTTMVPIKRIRCGRGKGGERKIDVYQNFLIRMGTRGYQ